MMTQIVPSRAVTWSISTTSNLGSRTQPNVEDYEISQMPEYNQKWKIEIICSQFKTVLRVWSFLIVKYKGGLRRGGGGEVKDFRYSHPVTSSDGTARLGGVFGNLTTLAGDGGRLTTGTQGSTSTDATAALTTLFFGFLVTLVGIDDHGGVLLVLVDGPVEDVVVLEGLADEQVTEDLAEVGVVGLVVEAQGTGVVEVDGEFVGVATAQDLGGGGHLLLHDTVVLLLLGGGLESLPGERTTAEVEHDVSQGFHIIPTRLLDTQVGVDTRVPCGTGEVLVLTVGDVEVSLGVTVLLGETKVDDIDLVAALTDTHEEVVGFDITVDEGLGMDVLDARDELVGEEEDGLERELAVAEVEEILETGT